MASHGIARTTRHRTEEQRLQDLEKIEKYRSGEDQVRKQITDGNYGQDTLLLTTRLLRQNPEYYTIWNVRRRCLISGSLSKPSAGLSCLKVSPTTSATDTPTASSDVLLPSSSTETPPTHDPPTAGKNGTTPEGVAVGKDTEAIRAELGFTIPLLMEFPKCYWIWNYRLWILQKAIELLPVPTARRIWEEELGLIGKMLTRDRRNFHAWGYRRHVISQLESPQLNGESLSEKEFEYTTRMINQDLSNFSAWHYRAGIIPRLLAERGLDSVSRQGFLDKELELVRDALNVGPEDQSLWFYHQFLISNLVEHTSDSQIAPALTVDERRVYLDREIVDIKDLLEDYQDIKWIYEALIEYTVAGRKLTQGTLDDQERGDIADWLMKLRELDPMRSGRWTDLENKIS